MFKAVLTAVASVALASPVIANAQSRVPGDVTGMGKPVKPANDPDKWVTRADYPKFALDNGIQGFTHYELNVDTNGKPTHCRITQTSGSGILNTTTCDLVFARSRFIPAETGAGFRVPSTYSGTVRWDYPRKLGSRTSANAIRIYSQPRADAERRPNTPVASYCQVIFKIGKLSAAEDVRLCQMLGTPDRVQRLVGESAKWYRSFRIRAVHYSLKDYNSNRGDAKRIKQELAREYAERFILQKAELEVTPQGKVVACKSLPSRYTNSRPQDPCVAIMFDDLPKFEAIDTSEGNHTVIQLYDVVMS